MARRRAPAAPQNGTAAGERAVRRPSSERDHRRYLCKHCLDDNKMTVCEDYNRLRKHQGRVHNCWTTCVDKWLCNTCQRWMEGKKVATRDRLRAEHKKHCDPVRAAFEMRQVPVTGNDRLDAQVRADLWDLAGAGHANPALVLRRDEELGDPAIEIRERKRQVLRLYAELAALPLEQQAKAMTPPGGNATLLQPRQQDEPAPPAAPAGMLQGFQQQAPQNPQHFWDGTVGPGAGVYAPQPPTTQQDGGLGEDFFVDSLLGQYDIGTGPGNYGGPTVPMGQVDLLRPQQYFQAPLMGYGDAALGYPAPAPAPTPGFGSAGMAHGAYVAQAPQQQHLQPPMMPVAGHAYQQYALATQGMAWEDFGPVIPAGQADLQDRRLVRVMG